MPILPSACSVARCAEKSGSRSTRSAASISWSANASASTSWLRAAESLGGEGSYQEQAIFALQEDLDQHHIGITERILEAAGSRGGRLRDQPLDRPERRRGGPARPDARRLRARQPPRPRHAGDRRARPAPPGRLTQLAAEEPRGNKCGVLPRFPRGRGHNALCTTGGMYEHGDRIAHRRSRPQKPTSSRPRPGSCSTSSSTRCIRTKRSSCAS